MNELSWPQLELRSVNSLRSATTPAVRCTAGAMIEGFVVAVQQATCLDLWRERLRTVELARSQPCQ